MSRHKESLNYDLDFQGICALAGRGCATPDELMQLGPHLEVCAECREQLYKHIQMSALELSEGYAQFLAGTIRKGDRSLEETEEECERLQVRRFLYAWGETDDGPQLVTLGVFRKPGEHREHCICLKDNPRAPVALDSLFARIERRPPGLQAGRKQALFFYWRCEPESMWEAVYDS
jgi:hypothetical protein